jgi:glutamate 5-kinase
VLLRLAAGESIGTLLVAPTHKTQARKQWIADHLQLRGSVTVDEGGRQAAPRGQEPAAHRHDAGGGRFLARRRDRHPRRRRPRTGARPGQLFQREARLLCRRPSRDIEKLLGYSGGPEMVHRDNLVLTQPGADQ